MKKTELRKKYLENRKKLSREEVLILSEKIFRKFILQFKPTENQSIHVFMSISKFNEVETKFFIDYFLETNIKIFVPKISGEKIISIELEKNTETEMNDWGIIEPKISENCGVKDFDFVITPLVYCDNFGGRVGYGKGFYDKFFNEINPATKKIGVSFFKPDEKIDDLSDDDIALDYLVTPDEILSFGGLL